MPTVSTNDKFTEVYVDSDVEEEEKEPKPPPPAPRPLINTERNITGEQVTDLVEAEPKKKKKKNKKKKKKAPGEATGFEASHIEAPLTLEQVNENKKIYAPERAFMERIETCIQRYKAKRRFDPFRMSILDSYLVLGGVRAGQKQFGGGVIVDDENKEEVDAVDIAMQAATDFVNVDMEEDEWYVDFELVVKAFFSERLPYLVSGYNEDQIKSACKLIWNFLNYVLYHNVAPEYTENIKAAVAICLKAEEELILIRNFATRLPGRFNDACSLTFGGNKKTLGIAEPEEIEKAKKRILESFAVKGTQEQKDLGLRAEYVRVENLGLEVLEVNVPPKGTSKDTLGTLVVQPWVPEGEKMPITQLGKFEIWLEKQVIQYAFVGLKFEANVHILNTGLKYIDTVTGHFCSFYTYLESPLQKADDEELLDDGDSDFESPEKGSQEKK